MSLVPVNVRDPRLTTVWMNDPFAGLKKMKKDLFSDFQRQLQQAAGLALLLLLQS